MSDAPEYICLICKQPVLEIDASVATPRFLTRRDPLWRYSGARLHRQCFADWSCREEFVRKFNIVMEGFAKMDATGSITWPDPVD